MQISFPTSEDTPVEFARQVRAAKISEEKLIQFAFYAPQWVNYIQHAIDLPGFAEGVWWIHAHTKNRENLGSIDPVVDPIELFDRHQSVLP
jgi:Family of unknown function (DUF5724)